MVLVTRLNNYLELFYGKREDLLNPPSYLRVHLFIEHQYLDLPLDLLPILRLRHDPRSSEFQIVFGNAFWPGYAAVLKMLLCHQNARWLDDLSHVDLPE